MPTLEQRMAAIFVVALVLMGWQAMRLRPVLPPAYELVTKRGEQLTPFAVAWWRAPAELPTEPVARQAALAGRSVLWPGAVPDPNADCQLFLRVSALHWVQRPTSRADLTRWWWGAPGEPGRLGLAPADFADDDDGDGDPLDAGELRADATHAEVEAFCRATPQSPGSP
jgi:hypothetical protein